jgi:phytoene dehydrogenase-like protein
MSDLPRHSDVVIVGGGAAGPAAARHLAATGAEVVLLESADRLGGRIVTYTIDGFRLDRGFQVVNTAYPARSRRPRRPATCRAASTTGRCARWSSRS